MSLQKTVIFDDISIVKENSKSDIHTLPFASRMMTKHEFSSLIGLRSNDLANNSPPFIEIDKNKIKNNMDYRKIAIEELRQRKLYYTIVRRMINHNIYIRACDPELDLTAVEEMMIN